ncbi:MAG: hypothetical protein FD181_1352 [Prolixibacteraceae bacterium]|nr:MAG: hypothetical protein FD181_1352 [Prolixibacteraceae bacterium]
MNIKHVCPFLFLLSILFSCVQDVNLEYKHESKLCLNCILNPDSIITASLTLSHALDYSGKFEAVNNAVITLYEEDNIIGTLKLKSNGKYFLNQRPVSGKTYHIVAESTGYESLKANTTVPEKPTIEYTKDTTAIIENLNVPIFDLNVQLFDKKGKDNYWLYITYIVGGIKYGGNSKEINAPYVDTFNRYIDSDSKYGFRHFLQIRMSDEGYDGQNLEFTIPDNVVYLDYKAQHFLNADEHYDKYIQTTLIKRMSENDDLPFYEPVQIYSNIENGYGIFGSCAITTIKL